MLQFLWNPVIVFSVSVLFGRWDGGWLVPQATPHREASQPGLKSGFNK